MSDGPTPTTQYQWLEIPPPAQGQPEPASAVDMSSKNEVAHAFPSPQGRTAAEPQALEVSAAPIYPKQQPRPSVNLVERLHLKNPANSTIFDIMKIDPPDTADVHQVRYSPQFSDPAAFHKTAQHLLDRAGGTLSKKTLDGLSKDGSLTPVERAVAQTMRANYGNFEETHNPGWTSEINQASLNELSWKAWPVSISQRHPEMMNPQVLSSTLEKSFDRLDWAHRNQLQDWQLDEDVRNSKLSEQEVAAAEMVRVNHDKFAALTPSGNVDHDDIKAISAIGTPHEPMVIAACQADSNALEKGAVYGAATYGVTRALGSKRAGTFGLIAGLVEAAASEAETNEKCQNALNSIGYTPSGPTEPLE